MKNIKKIIDRASDNTLSSNRKKAKIAYKKDIAKNPNSSTLLTEYILFSLFVITEPLDYREFLDNVKKLIELIPTDIETFNLIFSKFNRCASRADGLSSAIQEEYIQTLIKICELNPPKDYKDEILLLKKPFSVEELLIKISLNCEFLPESSISFYEQCYSDEPNDLDTSIILTLLYSQHEQYEKAVAIISNLNNFERLPLSANNHAYICSRIKEYPSSISRIIKTIKYTIDNCNLETKNVAFLAWLIMQLQDFNTAKTVYLELVKKIEETKLKYGVDFDIVGLCANLKNLENRPDDPLYKALKTDDRQLIQTYDEQSAKNQNKVINVLKGAISGFQEDLFFYEKVKKYSRFSRIISVDTHNYIIELYFTKIDNKKSVPKEKLIQNLGPGGFLTLKNPYLEKLKIDLLKNEKESIKKLNKILIRDLYWAKDLESMIIRIQGILHHIRGLDYIRNIKMREAISELKLAKQFYKETDICLDVALLLDLQEFHFCNSNDIEQIIDSLEPFVRLEEILKLQDLTLIKAELLELSSDVPPVERSKHKYVMSLSPIILSAKYAVKVLSDAFNFKEIDFYQLDRENKNLMKEGYVEVKKYFDSIINFCHHLHQYPNFQEAKKDEHILINEFNQIRNIYQDVTKYIDKKLKETVQKSMAELKETFPNQENSKADSDLSSNNDQIHIIFDKKVVLDGKPYGYKQEYYFLESLIKNNEIHYLNGLIIFPTWRKIKLSKSALIDRFKVISSRLNSILKKNTNSEAKQTGGVWTLINSENIKSNILDSEEKMKAAQSEKNQDKAIDLLTEAVQLYPRNITAMKNLITSLEVNNSIKLEASLAKKMLIELRKIITSSSELIKHLNTINVPFEDEYERISLETDLKIALETAKKIDVAIKKYLVTNKINIPIDKEYEELKRIIIEKDKDAIIKNKHINKMIKGLSFRYKLRTTALKNLDEKKLEISMKGQLIEILPSLNIDFNKVDTVAGIISYIYNSVYGEMVDMMIESETGLSRIDSNALRKHKNRVSECERNEGISKDEAEERVKQGYNSQPFREYIESLQKKTEPQIPFDDTITERPFDEMRKVKNTIIDQIKEDTNLPKKNK